MNFKLSMIAARIALYCAYATVPATIVYLLFPGTQFILGIVGVVQFIMIVLCLAAIAVFDFIDN